MPVIPRPKPASLGLEEVVGGRKSWEQSPWNVGRASHHPYTSCCATDSLKAFTCHRVKCWVTGSLCSSWTTCAPKLVLPLALISFHQWGWGLLGWDISSTIHQHANFTGSSPSLPDLVQDWQSDWLSDSTARTLGQAPPVREWLSWGLLVGADSWEGKLGVLLCLGAVHSAKKWVRSVGKLGSLPNSLSTLNQTCFLGFSSAYRDASHQHVLFLNS